ncbi:type VI secretion system protein TssA [Pseudorhodoferax sp.]|uniref:type VI secretion system protein TssA n=1 Tax=Pseudorhodoferax sp. TaxID=1993553 RepID=UPI0039E3B45C
MPAALDLDGLLAPLPGPAPGGPDLEHDPDFLALQAAGAGKPERQFGQTVIAAAPPDWAAVHQHALALATRSHDLRIATWLARSAAHVQGLVGMVQGLQLVHGLLEHHWEHVHPLLDASDGNDPTARISAIWPLFTADGLADLRRAALTPARGAVTVRDLELAFGGAKPYGGEAVPTAEGLAPAIAAAQAQVPALAEAMQAGLLAVQGMAAALDRHLGAGRSPDLKPLLALLRAVALAGRQAQGAAADVPALPGGAVPAAPPAAAAAPGAIATREDAIRMLQRVSEWIERNEPANPAPLFIQRAQRLMTKNFLEIVRDLMPDGVGQIEKLTGSTKQA